MPIRVMAQRFATLLLVAAAVGLMLLGRADNPVIERIRLAVVDAATPVLAAVSEPIGTVNRLVREVDELLFLRERNATLREENARLLQWQSVARRLEQENAQLRALVKARPDPLPAYVTARVVGDSAGPFVRTLLLNAGQRDGVKAGQAAIVAEGMVGRVLEAGERSARILLLSDLNSRVPVMIEQTRQRGILAGDNGPQPKLVFLAASARPQIGERIVTSGHDGMLPPGLPIGTIVSTSGDPRVELFTRAERIEYLRLVRYEAPRLQPPARDGAQAAQRR
jgi:rod shape-determining protein MreC